ncbi:MAG TPA: hypothetical protein PK990_01495 [Salinivirgaceae bacterium]|nr:hypothetical protein [Salinivirgaceae bacterium]
MSFADVYLSKQPRLFPSITLDKDLSGVIVIPCYSEPEVFVTLDSLCQCLQPKGHYAVIVVVNFPASKAVEEEHEHRLLFAKLESYAANNKSSFLQVIPLWLGAVEKKKTGAGYARKTGMDYAIQIFNKTEHPEAFILSLDADTMVSSNYLTEAERLFEKSTVRQIVFPFEHPKAVLPMEQRKAIILYELHLFYYRLALQHIGWPWPYHTLGSAFGVRASVYVEQGGMNSKNAGEDFYFLNKIFPLGGTRVATKAMVFPEARLSDRIIFGTGPALKEIIKNDLQYETYCRESFSEVRYFIENIRNMFDATIPTTKIIEQAPKSLRDFWTETHFIEKIEECRRNCNLENTFVKRIYKKFDAFQVVKFLNYSHQHTYRKSPVEIEAGKLLSSMNIAPDTTSMERLHRQLQEIDLRFYR